MKIILNNEFKYLLVCFNICHLERFALNLDFIPKLQISLVSFSSPKKLRFYAQSMLRNVLHIKRCIVTYNFNLNQFTFILFLHYFIYISASYCILIAAYYFCMNRTTCICMSLSVPVKGHSALHLNAYRISENAFVPIAWVVPPSIMSCLLSFR